MYYRKHDAEGVDAVHGAGGELERKHLMHAHNCTKDMHSQGTSVEYGHGDL